MLRVYEYAGQSITFEADGETYVNATEMARPFGKRVNDFINLKATQSYMEALETTIKNGSLIKTVEGRNGGTWMHEMLALEFAGWLAPAFKVWCNQKIKELLTTGQATVAMSVEDMMIKQLEILKDQKARLQRVAEEVKYLKHAKEPRPDYFTVAGYASYQGVTINIKVASSLGRKASQYCRTRGIPTDEIPDPRFGTVGMYPKYVLEKIFQEPI